jgi:glycosyltransferase involved in cell wall biosynthesis
MRICAIVKYPPIEGGVSALSYRIVMSLAAAGHQVSVVTNADEVEDDYRIWMRPQDRDRLEAVFPNGGSVTLVATSPVSRKMSMHIPHSKPFTTKLASLATEEIRRIDAEVVFSYYFEPYGLAAHLAAQWTGTPHVLQHAGSDRTRLLAHPELSLAYREILRRADLVVTQPGTIEGFGVATERVFQLKPLGLPVAFTDPDSRALDVDATIAQLAAAGHPWITNSAPMPRDRATFGIYGKLGEQKGSYDLVAALARLSSTGRAFNLLVMAGGHERERFLEAVRAADLADQTWTLPFLPHWRVPEFLRSLTAACFLERRFPVAIHTPGIPHEILTVGTCLVVSQEIADKQYFRDELRSGDNAYIVHDPSDVDELADTLGSIADDPIAAGGVGRAGRDLIRPGGSDTGLADAYEQLFRRAVQLRNQPAAPSGPQSALTDGSRLLLRRFMPATTAVLGESVDDAVRPLDGLDFASDAHRAYACAGAIVDWIGQQNGSVPQNAATAASFERDLLWSRVDLESADGGTMFPRRGVSALVLSEPVTLAARTPVTATGVRIRPYRADIEAVLAALRDRRDCERLDERRVTFLFLKRGDLDGAVMRIGPVTQALLRLCDGHTSVSVIAERLQRDHGVAAEAVEAAVLNLASLRVVWV